MFIRGCSFTRPPFLMFTDPADDAGGGGGDAKLNDAPKFPADTPVKEMTPEQQAAFHESKARRLEDKLKAFDGLTPQQVKDLKSEIADLKTKGQSAEEKAVEEAKEAGRDEIRQELAKERLKNALEKALTSRVPNASALLDLDRSSLVKKDGTVDADALKAWVDANSTAAAVPTKKNIDLGGGRRESVSNSAGDRGRSEAERRFTKKKIN